MAPKRSGKNNDHHAQNDSSDGSSSYFQKTVCLQDWWLVKADNDFEGKRLAVAGSTSRELEAVRLFTSAPIVKRYDVFTLETADGICVCIKGFINKQRTRDNGFSFEIFNHFSFGFPPYWEECARKYLGEKVTTDIEAEVVPDSCKSARNTGITDPTFISTRNEHEEVASQDRHVQMVCGENASKGPNVLKHVVNLSNEVKERSNIDSAVDMDYTHKVTEQTIVATDASNKHKAAADLIESIERVNHSPPNMETNKVDVRKNKNDTDFSPYVPGSRTTRSQSRIIEGSQKNNKFGFSTAHKDRASKMELQHEQKLNRSTTLKRNSFCHVNEKCSPQKEMRRKLDFEQVASPKSQATKRKQFVISPKSLSLKCSRSGRLLLPPLEFWRNQIPVYDQNRQITGIREEVDAIKKSGSRSEPQKRRKLLL